MNDFEGEGIRSTSKGNPRLIAAAKTVARAKGNERVTPLLRADAYCVLALLGTTDAPQSSQLLLAASGLRRKHLRQHLQYEMDDPLNPS